MLTAPVFVNKSAFVPLRLYELPRPHARHASMLTSDNWATVNHGFAVAQRTLYRTGPRTNRSAATTPRVKCVHPETCWTGTVRFFRDKADIFSVFVADGPILHKGEGDEIFRSRPLKT